MAPGAWAVCAQMGFVPGLLHSSVVWNVLDLSGPLSASVKWGQIRSFSKDSWECQRREQTWMQGGPRGTHPTVPSLPAPGLLASGLPLTPKQTPGIPLPLPLWADWSSLHQGAGVGLSLQSVLIPWWQWVCLSPPRSVTGFLSHDPALKVPTDRH